MTTSKDATPKISLDNPFGSDNELDFRIPGQNAENPGLYEETLRKGYDLMQRPRKAAGVTAITRQHS
ncbi:hypothetical protein, partial [Oleiphilus sp. HI0061]